MMQAIQSGQTLVSIFDNEKDAQEAVRNLRAAGFDETQIGVASKTHYDTSILGDETEKTAAVGAAAGLGAGTLWGLGVLAGVLPGIGTAIAGGTLAVLLSNAAVGAVAAGLGGALIGLGVADEDAKDYESEFNAGKTIVTVKAGDRLDAATSILTRAPMDVMSDLTH